MCEHAKRAQRCTLPLFASQLLPKLRAQFGPDVELSLSQKAEALALVSDTRALIRLHACMHVCTPLLGSAVCRLLRHLCHNQDPSAVIKTQLSHDTDFSRNF